MFKQTTKKLILFLELFGISIFKTINTFKGLPSFIRDYIHIKKLLRNEDSEFRIKRIYPFLEDRFDNSGVGKGHYFNQDLYIAQKIFVNKPKKHVDIGSRIDGFVAHVASFREIEVFDIRPLNNQINKIKFIQADLMSENFNYIDYCDSISSLHVIEHFGLGRYGDPITIDGYMKGLQNIYKMLKSKGIFYFSVPIGPSRIEFNAHRVFSISYLLKLLKPSYKILSFSYVGDDNLLYENAKLTLENIENNFNCKFGCGIFELEKY